MPRLGLPLLFVSFLLVVPNASAAGRDSRERAAKRACLNGDATKGVQILTELYIDSKDPTWIFNQGRCYEQSSRYEEAIGRFREYLRKITGSSDTDKASRSAAEKHIADCEALLGKSSPPQASPAQPAAPQPPLPQPYAGQPYAGQPYAGQPYAQGPQASMAYASSPPPGYAPAAQPPAYVVAQPPAAASAGAGLRIAGVATMAVGGAALIAGVVLNLKANSMVSDLQNHFDEGDYSSSKDYKTLSAVSYGLGAACVAGGAILYILGVRAGNRVAVAPQVAAGGAGAVLWGAF